MERIDANEQKKRRELRGRSTKGQKRNLKRKKKDAKKKEEKKKKWCNDEGERIVKKEINSGVRSKYLKDATMLYGLYRPTND